MAVAQVNKFLDKLEMQELQIQVAEVAVLLAVEALLVLAVAQVLSLLGMRTREK